jgi:hypothetical protein
MSDNLAAKVVAMQKTLDELSGMFTRVANSANNNRSWAATAAFGMLYESLRAMTGVNESAESVETALKVCGQSLSILSGGIQTEKFGNLFITAQTNDEAMSFWLEYAQQTGDTLSQALSLSKYDVSKFFSKVGTNLAQEAKAVAESANNTLPLVAVIAFVVLLIVILK